MVKMLSWRLQKHDDVIHMASACGSTIFFRRSKQRVKVGHHISSAPSLSTGVPQGYVLSPLLYPLYTYDCRPVGLISGGVESAHRSEVEQLVSWCKTNNLILNISKTKELIIDFRKKKTVFTPNYKGRLCGEDRGLSFSGSPHGGELVLEYKYL